MKHGERSVGKRVERREMKFQFGAATEATERHPENEDGWLADEQLQLAGVFDALGGLGKTVDKMQYQGAIPSQTAAEALVIFFKEQPPPRTPEDFIKQMAQAMKRANRAVLQKREDTGLKLGTTGTLLKIANINGKWYGGIGHVGDSRMMLLPRGKRLALVTVDDASWLNHYQDYEAKLAAERRFSEIDSYDALDALSEEEEGRFQDYQRGTVNHYLGQGRDLIPQVGVLDLEPGDRILLATDGLDALTLSRIEALSRQWRRPDKLAGVLVKEARKFKSTPRRIYLRAEDDDATVVVVDVKS